MVDIPDNEKLNEIYKNYTEEVGFERTLLNYKIRALSEFLGGRRGLDIGCGVGFVTRFMADRLDKVVGIDGSTAKIARAKEVNAATNIKFICAMFEVWQPTCNFDVVVATNVLEHLQDLDGFLDKCISMMSLGGRIIITVPNALGLHKRIGRQMGLCDDLYTLTEADHQKGHYHVFDRQRLETLLKKAGFSILHSGGILLKPLSHQQMEGWDMKIVDALYEVGKELPDYCSSLLVVGEKR